MKAMTKPGLSNQGKERWKWKRSKGFELQVHGDLKDSVNLSISFDGKRRSTQPIQWLLTRKILESHTNSGSTKEIVHHG
jgi:hypothetical protein